ncbi:estradiol 17-beta-dehydrogenase 8-like [Culicoides brevitarsis]|uniref:estradiol 17-beta-dehydrogenase 8-like n=1 Tax=Culicoides brevitarsis TaxID=469753 RepID=UPI00307B4A19
MVFGTLALVTGAGSGIGRAVCRLLSKQGATIIAADRKLGDAEDTVNSLKSTDAIALPVDVARSISVIQLLDATVNKYKRPPTVVVNSAGIIRDQYLMKMSEPDFDVVMDVNLKGTFLMMQYFARAMVDYKLQGSIVNLSSSVTKTGPIGQSNYAASKAGVEALTRVGAKEFAKFNIRCNVVIPGFIDTPIIRDAPEEAKKAFLEHCALKRFGTPEEVAEVIAFIVSDKASYINGASIEVNGG